MHQPPLHVVILAAGQGKRMHSSLPKVLHRLAGVPILERVVNTASELNAKVHVIYGHGGQQVLQQLSHLSVNWVEQAQQLGTGHAVAQALPTIPSSDRVLVLVGDTPLISKATLEKLLAATPANAIGLVTIEMPNPTGLGRILRDAAGKVLGIAEEKDADETQRQIKEINTGIMVAPAVLLQAWLPSLKNSNAQGEYYLTDIIALAVAEQLPVITVTASHPEEVQGINNRPQLVALERYYQERQALQFLQQGIHIVDPKQFDLRGTLQAGQDTVIDCNVIMEGNIVLGSNCLIEANCILRNVRIGNNVVVKSHSLLEDAEIADGGVIGPFARIRPGTRLAAGAHIGNFVEIKNAEIGENTKINHLSYIGDASIGSQVNIGAGTITCNYDGVNKHKTVIGDKAFIGSDTQLIAPVTIAEGATIGAGSTITKDAPAYSLTLSRAKQQSITGWQRPAKKDK